MEASLKRPGINKNNLLPWFLEDHGALPAQEMLEGVVLAVGGALLLTPGFVTDAFGFACLFPPTRRFFLQRLLARVQLRAHRAAQGQSGTIHIIEGEIDRRP